MFSMKTVLLLALFLYAASAAPAEDKPEAPEAIAVVDPPEEQMAAVPVPAQEEEEALEGRYRPCPAYWQQLGPRCFRFFTYPRYWFDAEDYCNRIGGHLASANNPTVDRFLEQMTWSEGEREAWLGGFHLQGKWTWVGGEGFHYTNWYSQLNPSGNPCLYLSTHNGWGSRTCWQPRPFICSRNP